MALRCLPVTDTERLLKAGTALIPLHPDRTLAAQIISAVVRALTYMPSYRFNITPRASCELAARRISGIRKVLYARRVLVPSLPIFNTPSSSRNRSRMVWTLTPHARQVRWGLKCFSLMLKLDCSTPLTGAGSGVGFQLRNFWDERSRAIRSVWSGVWHGISIPNTLRQRYTLKPISLHRWNPDITLGNSGGSVWKSNPPPGPRRTASPALKAGKVTGPRSPPDKNIITHNLPCLRRRSSNPHDGGRQLFVLRR